MKHTKRLVIALIALFCWRNSPAQVINPDTMVHRIFATLKTKDEKAFVALYPSDQVMVKLMTKMFAGIKAEMQRKQDSLPKNPVVDSLLGGLRLDSIITAELGKQITPEKIAEMKQGLADGFRRLMTQGEKRGIKWSAIQLVKYTYDTIASKDAEKFLGNRDYKEMKGILHFTAGDSAYQLPFNNVIYLPEEGGWYGVKLKPLAHEGGPLTDGDLETTEVELADVRDEPPPPPPPPSVKSKRKTTKLKASSKQKTKH